MLQRLRAVWRQYPARTVYVTTAVVVYVLARLGVVVDSESVTDALVLVLPVLLGGELTHRRVSPATPVADAPGFDDEVSKP